MTSRLRRDGSASRGEPRTVRALAELITPMPPGNDFSPAAQRIRRRRQKPPRLKPPPFARAPLHRPLSVMQEMVCNLLGFGYNYRTIAKLLGDISIETARMHAKDAAKRIPGDGPTTERCRMWARGASLDALVGGSLRSFILSHPPEVVGNG